MVVVSRLNSLDLKRNLCFGAFTAQRPYISANKSLHGMKAIGAYMGKSESTILKYIKHEGLPAAKIGGEWVSDEGRIDDWRLSRIG
jgi:hypothetical protein